MIKTNRIFISSMNYSVVSRKPRQCRANHKTTPTVPETLMLNYELPNCPWIINCLNLICNISLIVCTSLPTNFQGFRLIWKICRKNFLILSGFSFNRFGTNYNTKRLKSLLSFQKYFTEKADLIKCFVYENFILGIAF